MSRVYEFSWDFVGDIELGRPNLGNKTRIEVYRLFQYALRDILEQRLQSSVEADKILFSAGELAGFHFAEKFIGKHETADSFLIKAQEVLHELGVGILRVEACSEDGRQLTLSVEEDLDCSGLPDIGDTVCAYDEGFIRGLLKSHTGLNFEVREVDCWCIGDRTCRFEAKVVD